MVQSTSHEAHNHNKTALYFEDFQATDNNTCILCQLEAIKKFYYIFLVVVKDEGRGVLMYNEYLLR